MKMIKNIFLAGLLLFTSVFATSCGAETPYIGNNGNWWLGSSDLGVPATGSAGVDGKSVSVVSVEKTSTDGFVDTYTITFSDGTKTTFTVTNGKDGTSVYIESISKTDSDGRVDTYTIIFSNGHQHTFKITNGKNGESIKITSIEKTSTNGLVDTYVISFSDGTTTSFTVTNGEDGKTPYIGNNGNWWIGEEDTGVFAEYNYETRDITDGLIFTPMTIEGNSGMVLTSIDRNIAWTNEEETNKTCELIIPDYVGSVPVIGVAFDDSQFAFDDSQLRRGIIKKISLSKNTTYIEERSFYDWSALEEVDFNNAKLTEIKNYTFYNTKVSNVTIPETVTKLGDYAFSHCPLKYINYQNIKYFGKSCLSFFDTPHDNNYYIYLRKNVEYVGENAFSSANVYIEYEIYPDNWSERIANKVIVNCKKNTDYIYSVENREATIYQYFSNDEKVKIPSHIEGFPVTTIGHGFVSCGPNYEHFDDIAYNSKNTRDLILPNTIKTIGKDVYFLGVLVYVPASIEKVYLTYAPVFLAFEGTDYPIFMDGDSRDGDYEVSLSSALEYSIVRMSLGNDLNKIEYDESSKSHLYKDIEGYQLIVNWNYNYQENLIIPSSYLGLNIHTIKSKAFVSTKAEILILENGIKKIQKNAFLNCEFDIVHIPVSVVIINAYGFESSADIFYTGHNAIPSEWDSMWTKGSPNIVCNVSAPKMSEDGVYLYNTLSNGTIGLLRYKGEIVDNTINIPRFVDGIAVSRIYSYCYCIDKLDWIEVNIPNNITTIDKYGIYIYNRISYKPNAYFETSTKPDGVDYNYIYIKGYGRSVCEYFNRTFDY